MQVPGQGQLWAFCLSPKVVEAGCLRNPAGVGHGGESQGRVTGGIADVVRASFGRVGPQGSSLGLEVRLWRADMAAHAHTSSSSNSIDALPPVEAISHVWLSNFRFEFIKINQIRM